MPNCGERPQIGRVFKFRGTEMVGVFFHRREPPGGKRQGGGAGRGGNERSQHMEAALVSDDASRFGTTVNPMLKELLDAWHPGAATATAKRLEREKRSSGRFRGCG